MRGNKVIYKGVEYCSKEDLYKKHNVTRKAMEYRLSKGMTLEEALNYKGTLGKVIEYEGAKYKSISQIAKKESINVNTVRYRTRNGMGLKEAVTKKVHEDRVRIHHKGVVYNSLLDFASKFDLDYKVLRKATRVIKAVQNDNIIDGEELLKVIKYWGNTYEVTLYGRIYNSYRHLAESFGIDYNLMMYKVAENKGTLDKIVLDMLNSGIKYKGVKYSNLTSLCNYVGTGYKMVYARIMNGWTLEDSIETPKDLSRKRKNTIKYRGIEYYSKEDLCMDYGISTEFVKSVEKRTNRDFFYSLTLIIEFFACLKCEKPPIISKPPYVIYNGLWCETEKDFCDACNVELLKFRNAKNNMKAESALEYMQKYTNVKATKYYFKGKEIKRSNIDVEAKKNGLSLKNFVNSPDYIKEDKFKHPESTFKILDFCHNTLQEFRLYIDKNRLTKSK